MCCVKRVACSIQCAAYIVQCAVSPGKVNIIETDDLGGGDWGVLVSKVLGSTGENSNGEYSTGEYSNGEYW